MANHLNANSGGPELERNWFGGLVEDKRITNGREKSMYPTKDSALANPATRRMVIGVGLKIHLVLRIQLLERKFSNCLGDMQDLNIQSGMDSPSNGLN